MSWPSFLRERWYRPVLTPIPEPMDVIRGYPLLRVLHEGSMNSRTYITVDPEERFFCLYKQYDPAAIEVDPEEMFRHQDKIIGRLHELAHPQLEEVFEHFLLEDGLYIQIKPFLRCHSFWDWLETEPSMGARLRFLQFLGEMLHVLHENDIAHMDLKPEQLLMLTDPEGESWSDPPDFVLIDYDFSMVEGWRTMEIGTAPYYAPEQFDGLMPARHEAGICADVYAFAVIASHLLTERYPFGDGRSMPTDIDDLKESNNLSSLVIADGVLQGVMQRCLQRKPKARPSLEEVLEALRAPELDVRLPLPPLPEELTAQFQWKKLGCLAGSLAGLLGVAILPFVFLGPKEAIPWLLVLCFLGLGGYVFTR